MSVAPTLLENRAIFQTKSPSPFSNTVAWICISNADSIFFGPVSALKDDGVRYMVARIAREKMVSSTARLKPIRPI